MPLGSLRKKSIFIETEAANFRFQSRGRNAELRSRAARTGNASFGTGQRLLNQFPLLRGQAASPVMGIAAWIGCRQFISENTGRNAEHSAIRENHRAFNH